jgi:alpha-L-fucosidase
MEFYGFLHFTVNTFTDKEWGYGDESPEIFAPTAFDADQIVETAAAGGMTGLILTCKHHDGFCLWPSRYTAHSVKSSPWRGGRGDVVRDISRACAHAGLKFGVYLSPWDRNHADYGRPPYVEYYRDQLRELLTEYGPIFEVWFDGANGGDGFYGGAREKRAIDRRTYYGWEETWDLVRRLQPDACMFSDVGPDVRWVGNEKGIAGDPCWHTIGDHGFAPGEADVAILNSGERNGALWMPAECCVSIRPGWFYHSAEDDKVRTPENLLDLYLQSVGRGASLLLNLPPDRRGIIHERDAEALRGFGKRMDFLCSTAAPGCGIVRCGAAALGGEMPTAASGGACATTTITNGETIVDFLKPVTFNIVNLREDISQGQRAGDFSIFVEDAGGWRRWGGGTAIGNRRLVRGERVTAGRVKVAVEESGGVLREISTHHDPSA